MPDYGTSIVALIDSRVDQAQPRVTHFGTVTDRSTGSLDPNGAAWATVVFDGSAGATVEVKCFTSVLVAAGDRVGLVKFGRDWIIVGNYSARTLADVLVSGAFPSGSTSSASYADMPGSPAVTLTKVCDDTVLRVALFAAGFITPSGAPTSVKAGVRLSSDAVAGFDTDVVKFNFNTLNDHRSYGSSVTITGTLPAGVYTAVPRWLRFGGTATITVDNSDYLSMSVREVWP